MKDPVGDPLHHQGLAQSSSVRQPLQIRMEFCRPTGRETYGAGRYLDLDLTDRAPNGRWILDFNKAYNPWCVYSQDYACPFVPPENWLEVPINAGEKNYLRNSMKEVE
jgi:uncharacterized protein (DUF1684 family)